MEPFGWLRPQSPSPFPTLRMEDVGTRQQHCTELLDIWNGGLFILLAKSEGARSQREKDMIVELTAAIELLKKHLTGVASDYHETYYKDIIQHLPKAEEIKNGEV